MAAYAALNSVMYILQQLQHHPRPPITLEKQHMDSLCEIVGFLQDFLENYSHRDIGDGKEALESQICDAAYAVEDIIEFHIVDQILAREKNSNNLFYQDLQKVIEDMNLIKKGAIEILEKVRGINDDQVQTNIISMSANNTGSSTVPPSQRKNTNTMVGFDDVMIQIMNRLIGYPTKRQVLPIVGMGGIGKTTLAEHAYNKPVIVEHFQFRIWVTISHEYRLRDILAIALSCIDKTYKKDEYKSSEDELGVQLYQSLCGKSYLVILDDVWSLEACEELMKFFPDNKNGSRIMITTRLSSLSCHFGSCGFEMPFLDEDKSWDLFCKIVFPQDQCCPPELEETGMKIARNCKGLPLSIVVIGGLLANSQKTQLHWEYIVQNLNQIVNLENNRHCLKILYLSYNHLPIHLKPCFLYMGVFSEDSIITVPRVKKLWVAEGFLKPIATKSLEVVAEKYLTDLIDRNLILVDEWGSSGTIKYCKIHDLLRDLCLREAKKDKFLWVRKVHDLDNLQEIQNQRRISVHRGASKEYHNDRVLEALTSASLARSLICDFEAAHPYPLSLNFRLVRVFNMGIKYQHMFGNNKKYGYSLKDLFELVNSRYLEFAAHGKSTSILPSSIHLLWNLQTLIIKEEVIKVPPKIWEMSQLRHLEIDGFFLPDPPSFPLIHEEDDDYFILRNLHTLKRVRNFKLSEEVIKRIPNIKKLQLSYSVFGDKSWWHNYCLNNLGLLSKLESLNIDCSFGYEPSSQIEYLQNFGFPLSLKKLSLFCTDLHWEDMRMIGSLPLLQVLKLEMDSFRGREWNPVEGEFRCLKFLLIGGCNDLVCWNASRIHFPCLEQLFLHFLDNLEEIPLEIGQILTLRSIELRHCSDSVVMSAKNLLEDQVELGNEDLEVRVFCRKNVELESLATHNFQVQTND